MIQTFIQILLLIIIVRILRDSYLCDTEVSTSNAGQAWLTTESNFVVACTNESDAMKVQ